MASHNFAKAVAMKIDEGSLVSLDVSLYDAQGNLLEQSDEPLVYLAGYDDMLPGLEAALMGKVPGDRLALQLEPEDAFGNYDPDFVILVPVENLGEGVAIGMGVEGVGAGSPGRIFTITDFAEGMAVLDGSHPLAGLALRFDIKVVDVRPATAEELAEAESPRLPDFLRIAEPPEPTLH